MPEGLADGYYFAELLTAHAADPKDSPRIGARRLYFGVIKGELEPMTTHDWTVGLDDAEGTVAATSVELGTTSDAQAVTGQQQ